MSYYSNVTQLSRVRLLFAFNPLCFTRRVDSSQSCVHLRGWHRDSIDYVSDGCDVHVKPVGISGHVSELAILVTALRRRVCPRCFHVPVPDTAGEPGRYRIPVGWRCQAAPHAYCAV